jgi:transposase, IS30 family
MPKGYHHVTQEQRSQIYALKAILTPQNKIAEIIGVDPSTVCRELKRNTGQRGYRFNQADKMSHERRSKISQAPKKMNSELISLIEEKLELDWSPEQIAGRLKNEGCSISYESIYRYIREDKKSGGELYKKLRRKGKKYNKRVSGKAGRGCIPNRVDIENRPAIVEEKSRIGDWEGDTIIGAEHQGAVISYVDRSSKFTILSKVTNKTAELVLHASLEQFQAHGLPVLTITYDNGKEFSNHEKIAKALNAECYFAKPYHSWERGLNEHTNGLVRQYLPKKMSFKDVTNEQLQSIAEKLNHRPRRCLNYLTPFEFLHRALSKPKTILDG